MRNIQLEARLKDKTLSVNGKRVKLDDSLFYAGISRVLNRENETALELKYLNNNRDFACNEAGEISSFLEQEGLSDKVHVNAYPEEEFPTVALVGEINATTYN